MKPQTISEKIKMGLELSFRKLLDQRIKEDGEFVISLNNKIVHVKAKDLLKVLSENK